MKKEEIIRLLKKNKEKLKEFGVRRIGIFGSVARGRAGKESDIDVVVEFEEDRGGMHDFVNVVDFLENLFKRKVDILTPYGIESIRINYIRNRIKQEVEYV